MGLKLTCALGDRILIGDDVIAEVTQLGRRVQITINAPRTTKIVRVPLDPDEYGKNARREAEGRPRGGSPRFDDDRGNR